MQIQFMPQLSAESQQQQVHLSLQNSNKTVVTTDKKEWLVKKTRSYVAIRSRFVMQENISENCRGKMALNSRSYNSGGRIAER